MAVSYKRLQRSRLSTALFAAVLMPIAGAAFAQDSTAEGNESATELDKVTVTGSLIPQTQLENFTPVTVISAEDIQMRGFTSVSDVLQQSTYQTGGFQGGQTSASFTQGAEAAGMFGLDPGYTKYLINGRPMSNYPALYNGSDTFNNVSGIPVDLVERIEILPGGQSSLYGSDAIAGVVNVILKKQTDGLTVNLRGGWYGEGGGDTFRMSVSDGFTSTDGRFNLIAGLQYEDRDPIWGHQRDLTKQYNTDGYSAPVASRDYVIINGSARNTYLFLDPNNCENVTGQFGGTEGLQTRPGFGQYCGSFMSPGYRTIKNGKEATQVYAHATYDVNDNIQLYGDLLTNNEDVEYATGSSYTWWGTSAKYGYYYDPDQRALLNLQRAFSPEDIGGLGYRDIMNTDKNRSYQVTLGGSGRFGTNWDWDVGFTRTQYKLTERNWVRFADAIDDYFVANVLGPQLGTHRGVYPIFRPNYEAFYQPMSPADFASFTGFVNTESETVDNTLRAQLTNASLFSLPGGDAGLAVVVEGGSSSWDYTPDARMLQDPDTLESEIWGQTSVSGSGDRDRYAVTGELRLPLWEPLTVTVAGRYDAFKVAGSTIDKPTYSLGVEYRPVDSFLLRGKYGTAFRAPTLSDVFQGMSGYYTSSTDYYRCSLEDPSFTPGNTDDCTYDNQQYFGQQSGNPDLQPIEADVWNLGFVWAPMNNLSLSVDYFSWDIRDEVDQLSNDQLLLAEYFCRTGQTNTASTGCETALAWVKRGANNEIESVYTPKVNVSQQKLEAVTASLNYLLDVGKWGSLAFAGNYTNNIKHTVTPLPGAEEIDLLRDPYYMWVYDAYAKTRADASVGWNIGKWTTTAYANRIGKTPNYLAYSSQSWDYVNSAGAKAGWWSPYTTYNLSLNYEATENVRLSLLVNNVLNKMPDYQAANYPGTSTTPYNNYLYNPYGRSMYLEMRYNFGK
ncbi:TonB-dependent receptor plug domain-containing protein [Lysobacter cavernae]|uniref:TonB-dependent receptor plug domain-containing protein n=1 Tax=Lysobacter cavernae TaxID=1685901 RepID=A0ABV7RM11_9GAMM